MRKTLLILTDGRSGGDTATGDVMAAMPMAMMAMPGWGAGCEVAVLSAVEFDPSQTR